ncbi:MAG: pseudouridine synthase [Pseudomonadales bacterium]|nr:pseudouridine synthase [Pseudomonadales bacterium]
MTRLLLFNKPYRVLSQFTDSAQSTAEGKSRQTLAHYITTPQFYPAGRLDYDSEGLLLLTDNGSLQARIAQPGYKLEKLYWVQVEGRPMTEQLAKLRSGVRLNDGPTLPAKANLLSKAPLLWVRSPPVIQHREQNSSWLEIGLVEGRNRQVRRMCAAIGHPVLRLVRHRIGRWALGNLQPGESTWRDVHLPDGRNRRKASHRRH